jgi:uncharacterized protein (TIGR02594 family)
MKYFPFFKNKKQNLNNWDDMSDDDIMGFDFGAQLEGGFEAEKDTRKPIFKVASGIKKGALSKAGAGSFAKGLVFASLPKSYGLAAEEIVGLKDQMSYLYSNISRESDPIFKAAKSVLNTYKPIASAILPKKLASKLLTDDNETSSSYQRATQDDQDNATINSTMASIFGAEKLQADAQHQEQTAHTILDRNISKQQFEFNAQKQTAHTNYLARMVGYQDTVLNAYHKKSLELQYRQYFATKELLNVSSTFSSTALEELRAIKLNSALPNEQKILMSEQAMNTARQALIGNVVNRYRTGLSGMVSKFSNNLNKVAKGYASNIVQGLQGIESTSSMSSGLDMPGFDPLNMISEGAGSSIMGNIGSLGGNKWGLNVRNKLNTLFPGFNEKIASGSHHLDRIRQHYPAMALDKMRAADPNGILGFLFKVFDGETGSKDSVHKGLLDNANQQIAWDVISRRTLIDIIPGYLSRSLQTESNILNLLAGRGENAERITFDHGTEKFMSVKEKTKSDTLKLKQSISPYLKTNADKMISTFDDGTLTVKQKAEYALKFAQDGKSTFDPMDYADDPIIGEMIKKAFAIKENEDRWVTGEGPAFKRDWSDIDAAKRSVDAGKQFDDLKGSLRSIQEMLNQYQLVGDNESLQRLGLINAQGHYDPSVLENLQKRFIESDNQEDFYKDNLSPDEITNILNDSTVPKEVKEKIKQMYKAKRKKSLHTKLKNIPKLALENNSSSTISEGFNIQPLIMSSKENTDSILAYLERISLAIESIEIGGRTSGIFSPIREFGEKHRETLDKLKTYGDTGVTKVKGLYGKSKSTASRISDKAKKYIYETDAEGNLVKRDVKDILGSVKTDTIGAGKVFADKHQDRINRARNKVTQISKGVNDFINPNNATQTDLFADDTIHSSVKDRVSKAKEFGKSKIKKLKGFLNEYTPLDWFTKEGEFVGTQEDLFGFDEPKHYKYHHALEHLQEYISATGHMPEHLSDWLHFGQHIGKTTIEHLQGAGSSLLGKGKELLQSFDGKMPTSLREWAAVTNHISGQAVAGAGKVAYTGALAGLNAPIKIAKGLHKGYNFAKGMLPEGMTMWDVMKASNKASWKLSKAIVKAPFTIAKHGLKAMAGKYGKLAQYGTLGLVGGLPAMGAMAAYHGVKALTKWGWGKIKSIFVKGSPEEARITPEGISVGKYINTLTGKVIKSVKDITGKVIILRNGTPETVISQEEYDDGLVDEMGKPITGLVRTLVNKTLSHLSPAAVLKLGTMKRFLGKATPALKMRNLWDKAHVLVDLCLHPGGDPVIKAEKMRQGAYVDAHTGKPITSIYQIRGAVKDISVAAQPVIVLSDEEVKAGLYDCNTQKKLKLRTVLHKLADRITGPGMKGISSITSSKMWQKLTKLKTPVTGIASGVIDSLAGTIANKDNKIETHLVEILKYFKKAVPVENDEEKEAERPGGVKDLLARKAGLKGKPNMLANAKGRRGLGGVTGTEAGLAGLGAAGLALGGEHPDEKKDEDKKDDSSLWSKVKDWGGDALGLAAVAKGAKSAVSGAGGWLARKAGFSAATEVAGGLAEGATLAEGAAVGAEGFSILGGLGMLAEGTVAVLALPEVLIALGIGSAAYGIYKLAKNDSYNKKLNDLEKLRFLQYGIDIDNKEMVSTLRYFEDKMSDEIVISANKAPSVKLSSAEVYDKFCSDFNNNPSDKAAFKQFDRWFVKRFLPVFIKHSIAAKKYKATLDSINDKSDDLRVQFVNNVQFTEESIKIGLNPFAIQSSPFSNIPLKDNLAIADILSNQIRGNSKTSLANKLGNTETIDDPKNKEGAAKKLADKVKEQSMVEATGDLGIMGKVQNFFSEAKTSVGNVLSDAYHTAVDTTSNAMTSVANGASSVYNSAKSTIGGAYDAMTSKGDGSKIASGTFDQKAPSIMKRLMADFGLTPEQAAGIMGNLGHESGGLKIMQEIGKSGGKGGLGWAQWTGSRRKKFEAYLQATGQQANSDEANYGFLKQELSTGGDEADAIPNIKRAHGLTGMGGTVYNFERKFERSGDVNKDTGEIVKQKQYQSRYNYAQRALDLYNKGGGGTATDSPLDTGIGNSGKYNLNTLVGGKSDVKVPSSSFPWFAIAVKELGQAEVKGASANPRILEYLKSTNAGGSALGESDETPWCSAFVNWCVTKSGYKGTNQALAKSWLDWGKPTDTPVPGCIVVFQRGTNSGHVAFYVGPSPKGIKVLGGNQGDTVSISNRTTDAVLGYRVPNDSDKNGSLNSTSAEMNDTTSSIMDTPAPSVGASPMVSNLLGGDNPLDAPRNSGTQPAGARNSIMFKKDAASGDTSSATPSIDTSSTPSDGGTSVSLPSTATGAVAAPMNDGVISTISKTASTAEEQRNQTNRILSSIEKLLSTNGKGIMTPSSDIPMADFNSKGVSSLLGNKNTPTATTGYFPQSQGDVRPVFDVSR